MILWLFFLAWILYWWMFIFFTLFFFESSFAFCADFRIFYLFNFLTTLTLSTTGKLQKEHQKTLFLSRSLDGQQMRSLTQSLRYYFLFCSYTIISAWLFNIITSCTLCLVSHPFSSLAPRTRLPCCLDCLRCRLLYQKKIKC